MPQGQIIPVCGLLTVLFVDCWMAFGILSDDSDRYLKAIQLFHHTVADYLKFGRIDTWKDGHVLGQCTETMRDIYHSEFAMG